MFQQLFLVTLIGILGFSQIALTQTAVTASVLERGTKKPLSGVNVFLLPQGQKFETNSQGVFVIDAIPEGVEEIVINVPEYKRVKQPFNPTQKTYFLERESYQIFETTVTGQKNKRSDTQKTISQDQFLLVPGAGKDPVKAVQNLPGVNRTGGNGASVVIQGSDPNDTGYTIDGHRVPIIFHFGGLSSVLYPESVANVQYLSAGYGPEFSRQIGGFVGLETKESIVERTTGQVYLDIFNMGAMIEAPLSPESSILVAGRYSYFGFILDKVAEDNEDFGVVAAPTYLDLTAVYNQKLNDRDKLKVTSIISKDTLELVVNESPNNDPSLRGNFQQQTEFWRIIPTWSRQLDSTRSIELSAAIGRDALYFDVNDVFFDLKSNVLTVRGEYAQQVNNHWKTFLGFDNEYNWFLINLRVPRFNSEGGVSDPIDSSTVQEKELDSKDMVAGLYWRNEYQLPAAPEWTILPHLRYDYYKQIQEHAVQPRLAARYKLQEYLTLKSGLGYYTQAPEPQETETDFGNPDLKAPSAWHAYLGAQQDLRQGSTIGWNLDYGVFYKKLDNLVISDKDKKFSNDQRGEVKGLEVFAKYSQNIWDLQLSYTLSESTRTSDSAGTTPSEYDQTHNLNVIGSYRQGSWTYGARLRYVTGNPYTPIVGSSYDSDRDVYVPTRGKIFSQRYDNFFQLDVRIDRKWIYDTWILTAYLDIQNLSNSQNIESIRYSYDYSQSEKIMGLPLIPTFGIQGEF
ncbi:MAG: TonB-dependent receptor plug domain-containing protein [Bdellovibrionia bacterium]